MTSESIVILGWAGSGKTLFVGALTETLGRNAIPGVILDPRDKVTHQYVQKIVTALRNGEVPPSTMAGNPTRLSWNLTLPGLQPIPVQIIDSAGQDYQEIFGDAVPSIPSEAETPGQSDLENPVSAANESHTLPPHLQEAARVCRAATLVLLLLDLRQILGERNQTIRDERMLALKFALDFYRRHDVDCCLILTKWDQVNHLVEPGNLQACLAEHLPLLHLAERPTNVERPSVTSSFRHDTNRFLKRASLPWKWQTGHLPVFPISSVNKWKAVTSENGGHYVPAADFESEGLEPVVKWISSCIRGRYQWNLIRRSAIGISLFLLLICGFAVMKSCFNSLSSWINSFPTVPMPVILDHEKDWTKGFYRYPDTMIVTGTVRNDGAAGLVSFRAVVTCPDQTRRFSEWSETMARGESKTFRIEINTNCDVRKAKYKFESIAH